MNGRIHELWTQATLNKDVEDSHHLMEKFADLILQDVLAITDSVFANEIGSHASAHNSAIMKCQNLIKDHFGIKQ